jgi:hypothetical protein
MSSFAAAAARGSHRIEPPSANRSIQQEKTKGSLFFLNSKLFSYQNVWPIWYSYTTSFSSDL